MAATWERFFRYVQPHVPGCPEVVIENHLRDAAIAFCERSGVWIYHAEPFTTHVGVSDYYVDVEGGSMLDNVVSLHVDGLLLERVSLTHPPTNPTEPQGAPRRYSILEGQQVRLTPAPDKEYSVHVTTVLKPTLSARSVKDFIFEAHGQAIAAGALASLMVTPGKEWTNPELAAFYDTQFLRQADDAARRESRRTNLRVGSVKFA